MDGIAEGDVILAFLCRFRDLCLVSDVDIGVVGDNEGALVFAVVIGDITIFARGIGCNLNRPVVDRERRRIGVCHRHGVAIVERTPAGIDVDLKFVGGMLKTVFTVVFVQAGIGFVHRENLIFVRQINVCRCRGAAEGGSIGNRIRRYRFRLVGIL